ncbi:hypothetical protein QQS21_008234 [Conoideocrella luteorostrata]|uniref:Uncharacterized protein n=1 Tax=Conoideocrella luteorostrata TaxID=1105319 RepID=A0AAJ0CLX8_9HYPO|nr:hypothetical protein QQS21_008234 [Conoideocrella luteorostrata]
MSLTTTIPAEWETPSLPLPSPRDIAAKISHIPMQVAKAAVEGGAQCYKHINEGRAAGNQTKLLASVRKEVPRFFDDTHNYLASGTEKNHTIKQSVRQMADQYDRMANAHVNCADAVQKNVGAMNAAVSSSSKSVSDAADAVKKAADGIVPEVHGVRLMLGALNISAAAIAVIMQQMLNEIKKTNHTLGRIREELWRDNFLKSSGGAGDNGFAEVVYNLAAMEMAKPQYAKDFFFVWNPDTSWHPAFYAKIRDTPLHSNFLWRVGLSGPFVRCDKSSSAKYGRAET